MDKKPPVTPVTDRNISAAVKLLNEFKAQLGDQLDFVITAEGRLKVVVEYF